MKKTLILISVLALVFSFSSCKKGEEDPSISLLSRKARLTGVWQLNAGTWYFERYDAKSFPLLTPVDEKGTLYTTTYEYKDGSLTKTNNNGRTYIYNPYTYKITINKDNTFKIEKYSKYTDDDYTDEEWIEETGYWYFLDGDKEAGVKDKERIVLQLNKRYYKEVETYDGDTDNWETTTTYEGTTTNQMYIFDLKRLANKEIKIVFDNKNIDEDGDYNRYYGEMDFVQVKE